ncbi:hypothetical protein NKH71_31715 [Mesorhizobium sp. M0983]|uniref:hypothetical protein n=1 Tax=Mesorhizobium sp. M0983 TaxID=2957040 RepID=UPI00333663AA
MSIRRTKFLIALVAVLIVNSAYMPSPEAGLLSLFEKGLMKAGEEATEKAATSAGRRALRTGVHAGTFTERAAAVAASIALPTGALYVEREGDRLITWIIGKQQGPSINLAEPNWQSKLQSLAVQTKDLPAPAIVFDYPTARSLRSEARAAQLLHDLYVVDELGRFYPLRNIPEVGFVLELKPSLVVPISDPPPSLQILSYLDASVDTSKLHFITTMTKNDADSLRRLATNAGDKLIPLEDLRHTGNLVLPGTEGSLTIFIGHVEGDGFAIRLPDGTLAEKIGFDVIEDAAAKQQLSVLFVGCNTYACSGISGTTREVRDTEIAEALTKIMGAQSNADLIEQFGTRTHPFVISNDSLSVAADRLQMRLYSLPDGARTARTGAIGLRLSGYLPSPADPGIWVVFLWLFGAGVVVARTINYFDDSSLRQSFGRVYPSISNRLVAPRRHRLQSTVRELVYMSFAPLTSIYLVFVVVLSAFNFSVSAWSKRDDVMESAWSLLIVPHLVALGLAIFLSDYLVLFAPVALSFTAIYFISEGALLSLGVSLCVAFLVYMYRPAILVELDRAQLAGALWITKRHNHRFVSAAYLSLKTLPVVVSAGFIGWMFVILE